MHLPKLLVSAALLFLTAPTACGSDDDGHPSASDCQKLCNDAYAGCPSPDSKYVSECSDACLKSNTTAVNAAKSKCAKVEYCQDSCTCLAGIYEDPDCGPV